MLRVIIPDSHGSYIDRRAADAFLDDLRALVPEEIVLLGDHVDASGIFSQHPRNYVEDLTYAYEEDCEAANSFLDQIQKRAPRAVIHYLEGNHEAHVERWISRTFVHARDAEAALELLAPDRKLRLKERGIRFYRTSRFHHGLAIRGTIRLGKCLFTHGISAAKHATATHLDAFGTNVVHGHTHRAQSYVKRTAHSGEIGAWCPGTLAQLQPLYQHTAVSSWTHGYGLQLVERDGRFMHVQVPIVRGRSMLRPLLKVFRAGRVFGGKGR